MPRGGRVRPAPQDLHRQGPKVRPARTRMGPTRQTHQLTIRRSVVGAPDQDSLAAVFRPPGRVNRLFARSEAAVLNELLPGGWRRPIACGASPAAPTTTCASQLSLSSRGLRDLFEPIPVVA